MTLPDGVTNFSAPHAALLHNGKVLFIATSGGPAGTLIWDPDDAVNPAVLPDDQPDDNLFCSGYSFLSDGRLLVVGGGGWSPGSEPEKGWNFDPMAGTSGVWNATAGGTMGIRRRTGKGSECLGNGLKPRNELCTWAVVTGQTIQ